ncbi:MFS transporter [Variovorax sp. E3]|uniref:MFS transporter n=1 Tax=Variovorax sp. E3 TaxID=1914993 RepID=UPI0018DDA0B4|nr:MFS transporter [Variovorax sp. E3]
MKSVPIEDIAEPHPPSQGREAALQAARKKKALVAAIIGNALEWYDFIVYGFLAVFIAKQFFPPGDDVAALLLTFATFALSFAVRPVGGVLIGLYADRFGRRPALSFIMATMTVSMLIMVVVPSYASIGVAATVLMVIARILQALSAGGEFASAATYLLESVPEKKRGLYSGLYSSGPLLATVMAALVGLLMTQVMSPESRDSWGWRVPFAFGLLIAPVGYYIRRYLPESEVFEKNTDTQGTLEKLRSVFRDHRRALVVALSLAAIGTSVQYVLLVYAPTYAVRELKLPPHVPFLALLVCGSIGMILTPLLGMVADRVGAQRQLHVSLGVLIVLIMPLYVWMTAEPSTAKFILCSAIFTTVTSASNAVYPKLMAYLFPPELRSTGMAISYNLSATVFGGFSLYAITVLLNAMQSTLVPALYVVAVTAVFWVILVALHRPGADFKV